MNKLALIDLDGTLLGPDKTISAANLAALGWLEEAGFRPTVASGRHHRNILQFGDRLDLSGWIVSSHGAVVAHATSGEVLHEMIIPLAEARAACLYGTSKRLTLLAHHNEGIFANEFSSWTDEYTRRAGWAPRRGDLAALAEGGFTNFLFIASKAELDALQNEVFQRFAPRNHVVRVEEDLIEMIAAGASKAAGGRALTQQLGLEAADTLAFGDANNDVEMLRWAGLSVAMPHGTPAARQSAKLIGPMGNREEAFARAVEAALQHVGAPVS